jgi:PKD repeat protein
VKFTSIGMATGLLTAVAVIVGSVSVAAVDPVVKLPKPGISIPATAQVGQEVTLGIVYVSKSPKCFDLRVTWGDEVVTDNGISLCLSLGSGKASKAKWAVEKSTVKHTYLVPGEYTVTVMAQAAKSGGGAVESTYAKVKGLKTYTATITILP